MSPDGCKICLNFDNKIQIWNFAADTTEILQGIAALFESDDQQYIKQANNLLQKMPKDIQNAVDAELNSLVLPDNSSSTIFQQKAIAIKAVIKSISKTV